MKCQWCGFESDSLEDFEIDNIHKDGFWCPYCDGHTFFHPENNQNRFLLLLESKTDGLPIQNFPHTHFRKRLSPFRYPGGKSKLIDYLYSKLNHEKLHTFVEVFAGGASLGLSLLDAGVIQNLVLNDLDDGIYAFWHTVLNDPNYLIKNIYSIIPTHSLYTDYQNRLLDKTGSVKELAWYQFVVNRLSFSGISFAGPLGGKKGSQECLLSRWNPDSLIQKIQRIHQLKDQIQITHMDGCDLIADYSYWEENSTLFVDPPYWDKGKWLYPSAFSREDHERLAFLLTSLYKEFPEADILVTYDDASEIKRLYWNADVEIIRRQYSI